MNTLEFDVKARLRGIWVWVHQRPPKARDLDGFAGAIVKAANGNGTVGDGFDFAANYERWAASYGDSRCVAWTFLYPETTKGKRAADALVNAAPEARAYIADVEDYKHQQGSFPRKEIAAFFERMRELRPGAPVGFSSYPTRKQAMEQKVPWDALLANADFGAPQVYYDYQLNLWETVVADHGGKPLHAAFCPAAAGGDFLTKAQVALSRYGGISIWILPIAPKWRQALAQLTVPTDNGLVHVEVDLPPLDLRNAGEKAVDGPAVRRLQGLLAAAGQLEPADITGSARAETRDAVIAFKTSVGLADNAIVGSKAWRKLLTG